MLGLFNLYFLVEQSMSIESVPRDLRNLRACILCSMVKSFDQFETDGCDNCDRVLSMKHDRDKVYDCTSSNFDGLISMMQPKGDHEHQGGSWVAKWQNIANKVPGVYAVSVSGSLSDHIVQELKEMGVHYRNNLRDTTVQ